MMLVRQLAHLNFGMPRVRSHGAPFVAARDDHEGRNDKKEAGTKRKKKGSLEIGIGSGKETGKTVRSFCPSFGIVCYFQGSRTPSIMTKYFN